MDAIEVRTRLERICRIREREIVGITVDHDLEEVVEIFARLNGKGTRVREADIYLGIVATRSPGWVRQHFMPFLDKLESDDYFITPNLLFQTLTAVGVKRVRFKQISEKFWDPAGVVSAWERTKRAWYLILKFLEPYGILTNNVMPSDAVFVPLAALFDKFKDVQRQKIFYWMLQALRYGRFSGASTTSLDEDLREIESATTAEQALTAMTGRIRAIEPVTKDEFLRAYSDARFGRRLLYLLVFDKAATDWSSNGDRIAFQGSEPDTNIRISNKNPLQYFSKYDISEAKRAQQFIEGDVEAMTPENFPAWIEKRADALAAAANKFIHALTK